MKLKTDSNKKKTQIRNNKVDIKERNMGPMQGGSMGCMA